MKARLFKHNNFEFLRVNKITARRAYNNGLTVIFCPVNIIPFGYWGLSMDINKNNINCDNQTFENVLTQYEYYNCNNETGNYTAFYIPVKNEKYDYDFMEV